MAVSCDGAPARPWYGPRIASLVLAAALLIARAAPTHGTMVERLSLERVASEAARIVHATVVEVRSGRDESGLPATWVTLDVIRTLKGPHDARVTIKQYGVTEPLPDGTITRLAGLPRYSSGEEVVLFLRDGSRRGFSSPVGLGQGAYRVRHVGERPSVRRDAPPGGSRDLEEFLSAVAQLAAPAR